MPKEIFNYRLKHPRCRYCKYHKWIEPSCIGYWKCLVKAISLIEWSWRWHGWSCKYFKVKEEDIDI